MPLLLVPVLIAALPAENRMEQMFGDWVEDAWRITCLLISFLGLAIRILTIGYVPPGTSGRNTRYQRAESLNTTGIYSIVRHPLYLGNFIILAGIVLTVLSWWLVLICCLCYIIYHERIMLAEEGFLSEQYGEEYRQWVARTPAFIPNFKLWRRTERAFSWKKILRQEYHAFYLIIIAFSAIEFVTDVLIDHKVLLEWLGDDWVWIAQFGLGTVVFVLLRYLKRHTSLLSLSPG